MSNSSLVSYTCLSPNNSGPRTKPITIITPHCFVGQVTVERMGKSFSKPSKMASSNYGIGVDGQIGLYVDEGNRSWCSSSRENDQRAVTIECASDAFYPYKFDSIVYGRLIELCIDICKRNGKRKLLWFANKNKTMNYTPKPDEMLLSVHRWFSNKSCPGDWLYSRMSELADTVTARLNNVRIPPYLAKIQEDAVIRKGAGINTRIVQRGIEPGIYTIVEEKTGAGSEMWCKLKSGIGWVPIESTVFVRNI